MCSQSSPSFSRLDMTHENPNHSSKSNSIEPDLEGLDVAELAQTALGDPDNPSQPAPGQWEPPSPEDLGPFLPAFTIESILGRGGMGAVYRAMQKSLDRPVAIKLLPPELSADPEFEARFKREAKAMARLNHPNIVQIYDFGQTEGGHYYFVMEFVEGVDLHHFIREGNLDSEGALNAVSQICDALQYAHEKGFVHRDIKPANIFLNTEGVLKVGDFGLAKLVDGETLSATEQLGLTMTGVAMGTPHYIAPEQLSAEGTTTTDHRADIYSLGVMFYEMLTGDLPRGAFKSPSERNEQIDVRIDGVVYRAMDSDPADRYQSAADLRSDVDVIRATNPLECGGLTPLLEEEGVNKGEKRLSEERLPQKGKSPGKVSKSGVKPPHSKRLALIAVLTSLIAVAGIVWWAMSGNGGNTTSGKGTPDAQPNLQVAATRNEEQKTTNLKSIPGFTQRLEAYLKSRNEKLTALAAQYAKALDSKLNAAADAGDLKLAKAFREEKQTLSALQQTLLDGGANPVESAGASTDLPELVADAPDALRTLRKTWTVEHDKIRTDLDGKLNQSLKALESELTMAREFSKAEMVMGYREGKVHSILGLIKKPKVQYWWIGKQLSPKGRAKEKAGIWEFFPNGIATLTSPVFKYKGPLSYTWEIIGDDNIVKVTDRTGNNEEFFFLKSEKSAVKANRRNPKDPNYVEVSLEVIGSTKNQMNPGAGSTPVAASATKAKPFENSLGMKFVPVPITGGPTDGKKVLFSIWETRVMDYRVFAEETKRQWPKPDFEQGDDHPAVMVSWEDAVAFCEWLTERERMAEKIGAKDVFRLPSDHEWSCAVGIGGEEDAKMLPFEKRFNGSKLPGSGAWPPKEQVGNLRGVENAQSDDFRKPILDDYKDDFIYTSPVGSFPPNQFQIFDLTGNAFEWIGDWFETKKERKVQRGGSYQDGGKGNLYLASRIPIKPNETWSDRGFRAVLDLAD